jgi:hypothetical protein
VSSFSFSVFDQTLINILINKSSKLAVTATTSQISNVAPSFLAGVVSNSIAPYSYTPT